jgi:hypothetical protein
MHTCQLHRFAAVLLMLGGFALAGVAWGLDLTAWIAVAALLVSALLVAGVRWLHDAWRTARWDAGERLN